MRWLSAFGFTFYGLFILAIIEVGSAMDLQYDAGVVGGTFHFIIVPVLGFMYWFPDEVMWSIGGGKALPHQDVYAIAIGLLLCVAVDGARHLWRHCRAKYA